MADDTLEMRRIAGQKAEANTALAASSMIIHSVTQYVLRKRKSWETYERWMDE